MNAKGQLDEANEIVIKTNKNLEEALKRPNYEKEELAELQETLKRERFEKIRAE